MEKKYIIANWKCTKTIQDCLSWVDTVGPHVNASDSYEVIVCPPFMALDAIRRRITDEGYALKVGSQTVSSFEKGAYTGEVSAMMLTDLVDYALLGHSERRSFKHETNEDVAKQVDLCVRYDIEPVVLIRSVEDTIPESVKVFAWEPVSAIGTGNAIDAETAGETISQLSHNGHVRGLYGGSVNPSNIASFMQHPNIAGVLIGSASYEPSTFMEMLNALR